MIKIANNLSNVLIKMAAKPDVKNMLDMDSLGGMYVDTLPIGDFFAFSQNPRAQRAGRATAMAEALNMDPGLLVNYPQSTDSLSLLGGGLAGAGLGAGIGHATGGSPGIGAIAGGVGGGLLGLLASSLLRRSKMKEIAEAYEKAPVSKINPKDHDPSSLDILGGAHNKGRQKAIAAMLGLEANPSDYSTFDIASGPLAILGNAIVNPVGSIGVGGTQNVQAKGLREENLKKLKKKK